MAQDVELEEALGKVFVEDSYTYHVYQTDDACDELHQNTYDDDHGNAHDFEDKLCIENVEGDKFYLFV